MPALSAASTLAEADGWWIATRCPVCGMLSHSPCRMLARELLPSTTVGEVAARLICRRCRVRPETVDLIDNPQYAASGFVGSPGVKRIPLIRS